MLVKTKKSVSQKSPFRFALDLIRGITVTSGCILLMLLSCTANNRIDVFAEEVQKKLNFTFETSQKDLLRARGEPDWRGNFEGSGVFLYKDLTFYFTDTIGYFEENMFVDTANPSVIKIAQIEITESKPVFLDFDFTLSQKAIIRHFGSGYENREYVMDDFYGSCTNMNYSGEKYLVIFSLAKNPEQENRIYIRQL